jgi:hypothetical protein
MLDAGETSEGRLSTLRTSIAATTQLQQTLRFNLIILNGISMQAQKTSGLFKCFLTQAILYCARKSFTAAAISLVIKTLARMR